MLEIIRVLMTSTIGYEMSHAFTFQRDIIFLFNGAEEVLLAASHGFITKVNTLYTLLKMVGVNGK